MPVFAGLFAWLFLRESQGLRRWLGYATICIGLAGLVASGAALRGSTNIGGLLALVVAAAMWASYTLRFRKSGLTAIQSAAVICVWSSAIFVPAYLLLGLSHFRFASASEIAFQIAYQGILMSGVAIVTFNRSVEQLGAAAATSIIALLPAVASGLAIPVLGEIPTAAEAAAILVIVAGALLSARPASAAAVHAPPSI